MELLRSLVWIWQFIIPYPAAKGKAPRPLQKTPERAILSPEEFTRAWPGKEPTMFRELARKKQALSQAECIRILEEEPRGVLSVLGDDDYPYGLPINHWYCPEDGRIYFHSGRLGHKIDAIRRHDKASFCVYDQGFRREGEWWLNIRSVVVFGRIEPVADHQRALELTRRLSYKYTGDTAYIEKEIHDSGPGVLCFALIPEHMTGKLVKEK